MVQMAFCDLSHTFHKLVTNVSQHVFVFRLWGILTSPLEDIYIKRSWLLHTDLSAQWLLRGHMSGTMYTEKLLPQHVMLAPRTFLLYDI